MNTFSRIFVASWVTASVALPIVALGQEAATSSGGTRPFLDRAREVKSNILERQVDVRNRLQGTASTVRDVIQGRQELLKDHVGERREDLRAKLDTRRDALRQKFGEMRLARIEQYAENMFKRFEAAVDKLAGFTDRISARLDKAEENGKDVADLRTKLDAAKTSITAAETTIADAKSKLASTTLAADDPKKSFQDVKALLKLAQDALKKAHADLILVIRSTKGLGGGGAENTATSTATSTPQ